jgi:hypothetical protein
MERYLKRFLIVGMMIAFVAMLGFPPQAAWAAPDSRQTVGLCDVTALPALAPAVSVGGPPYEVLVIEDVLPWGYNGNVVCGPNNLGAVEEALNALGKTWQRVTSATFSTMTSAALAAYKIIIIPSDQTGVYYDNIDNNISQLIAAVQMGSIAIVHMVEGPNNGVIDGNRILPSISGGFNGGFHPYGVNTGGNIVTIDSATNCIVAGQANSDFSGWQYSTHGVFGSLGAIPTGAEVIMSDTSGATPYPCMIQYALGDGYVIATTQTVEYAYAIPTLYQPLLLNEIRCAQLKLVSDEKLEAKLDKIEAKLDDMGIVLISVIDSLTKIDTATTSTQTTVNAIQTTSSAIEGNTDAIEAKGDAIEAKLDNLCPFPQPEPTPNTWPRWRQQGSREPVLPLRP